MLKKFLPVFSILILLSSCNLLKFEQPIQEENPLDMKFFKTTLKREFYDIPYYLLFTRDEITDEQELLIDKDVYVLDGDAFLEQITIYSYSVSKVNHFPDGRITGTINAKLKYIPVLFPGIGFDCQNYETCRKYVQSNDPNVIVPDNYEELFNTNYTFKFTYVDNSIEININNEKLSLKEEFESQRNEY